MAKIEMDVTEYDEMRKRSELAEKYAASLESSKKEISDLHAQLQAKDKERIEELENSTKSVTYIRKETVTEMVLVKNDKRTILDKLIMLGRHAGMASIDGRHRGHGYSEYRDHLERQLDDDIVDAFFEKTTMRSTPVLEVVERKNLDEVISEIRLEEREKLDKEVTRKLARLDEVSNENSLWRKDNDMLKKENKALSKALGSLEDRQLENTKLQEEIFQLGEIVHKAYDALQSENYFNAYFKLREAKRILNIKTTQENGKN